MDPCEDLRVDLDIAIEGRTNARWEVVIRAFLGVIGFEWLYDLLKYKRIDWSIFIDLLVAGDFCRCPGLARHHAPAGRPFGGRRPDRCQGRPMGPRLPLVILVVEIGVAFSKWLVRRLYDETDCREGDAIFKEKGIPIPTTP